VATPFHVGVPNAHTPIALSSIVRIASIGTGSFRFIIHALDANGAPRWQLDVTQGACDQGAEGHALSQLLRGQAAIGGAPLSPSSVACGG
jgi:hypothetical protein